MNKLLNYNLLRKVAIIISCLIMLYTNLWGSPNLGDFTKETAGNTSMYYNYNTYFTPAPYTFIIWGIIFLSAIFLVIFQAMPKYGNNEQLNKIVLPLSLAYLVNACTPFTPIGYSNIAVTALFILLLITYNRINRYTAFSGLEKFIRPHIVIFLAWSMVALVLNSAQWLVSLHVTLGEYGNQILVFLLMCFLSLLHALIFNPQKDYAFLFVIVWAFMGILFAHRTVIIGLAVTINVLFLIWNYFKTKPLKQLNAI